MEWSCAETIETFFEQRNKTAMVQVISRAVPIARKQGRAIFSSFRLNSDFLPVIRYLMNSTILPCAPLLTLLPSAPKYG
jgi:hypothetical protein